MHFEDRKSYWLCRLVAALLNRLSCFAQVYAAPPAAQEQLNTFNSIRGSQNYEEASALIAQAGLPNYISQAIQVAVDFERSNWATDSVRADPFYTLPANASHAKPGDLLKIDETTNATQFTLAPNLALSRILCQTETLNSSSVPASAFVLWPWAAKQFPTIDGYPVVLWTHGTSRFTPECASSHVRNL